MQTALNSTETVGLLDETTTPEVVLVGTSFSSDTYSFDKFIHQSATVDVLSLSTDGGSNWSSLERFFMEDITQNPKVMIWEFVPKNQNGVSMPCDKLRLWCTAIAKALPL
jgi:SGNH hydrolase-like domain, acetyltransferase AlgX